MRDAQLGLEIADISSLPLPIREILTRKQLDVRPLVYFADCFTKLSHNAVRRFRKVRYVVLTADTCVVFTQDGVVKRRFRILDISVILIALSTFSSSSSSSSAAAGEQGSPKRESGVRTTTTNSASSSSSPKGGGGGGCVIGLEVPTQFDAVFDVTGPRAVERANRFFRVLIALDAALDPHGRARSTEVPLQTVTLAPQCFSSAPDSELHYYRLKKKESGSKLPPTYVAPPVPYLTEAMEAQRFSDAALQLADANDDVAKELREHSVTCWERRTTHTAATWTSYRNQMDQVLQEAAATSQRHWKLEQHLHSLRATAAVVAGRMGTAKQSYDVAFAKLTALRQQQQKEITEVRLLVDHAEERTAARRQEGQVLAQQHTQLMRAKDAQLQEAATRRVQLTQEHAVSALLPSVTDLNQQIDDLLEALRLLDLQQQDSDTRLAQHQQAAAACHALEQAVARKEADTEWVLQQQRDSTTATQALFAKVSSFVASRDASLRKLDRLRQQIDHDAVCVEDLATLRESLLAEQWEVEDLIRTRDLEEIVQSDFLREASAYQTPLTRR